ncbi:MAG: hypothetical protein IIC71_12585 [Acidobacteria bacterium]|nr:hypothetical protein [Acidobacteriota bacterium]
MKNRPKRSRDFWPKLLHDAADIVNRRGETTLRQLHYLLASADNEYRNVYTDYDQLSKRTAQGRRELWFPSLTDYTRSIYQRGGVNSVSDALLDAAHGYKRDYRDGQPTEVWIVVEKAALLGMAAEWSQPYGIPYVALGGYGSQTIMDDIVSSVGDEAVVLYIGDFDPSGVDIQRDFTDKTGQVWSDIIHIAVTSEQVTEYNLPPAPGKTGDSRAASFIAEHGSLFQVEAEAFEVFHPTVLAELVTAAIEEHTDMAQLRQVQHDEIGERESIIEFVDSFNETPEETDE